MLSALKDPSTMRVSQVCMPLGWDVAANMYTGHCTLTTVHCTLYTVHCTLTIVHSTLYTVQTHMWVSAYQSLTHI